MLHLDLSDNFKLGPAGAEAICHLLPPSFAPDGTPALRTLSLVNSGCGSVGAAALGAALELNTTLTRIEISDCRLGDAGAVAFGSALAENVCLEVCNLSDARNYETIRVHVVVATQQQQDEGLLVSGSGVCRMHVGGAAPTPSPEPPPLPPPPRPPPAPSRPTHTPSL